LSCSSVFIQLFLLITIDTSCYNQYLHYYVHHHRHYKSIMIQVQQYHPLLQWTKPEVSMKNSHVHIMRKHSLYSSNLGQRDKLKFYRKSIPSLFFSFLLLLPTMFLLFPAFCHSGLKSHVQPSIGMKTIWTLSGPSKTRDLPIGTTLSHHHYKLRKSSSLMC